MKIKINQRLLTKINNSDLDEPIKKFVKNILDIESEIGKGGQFSEKYKAEIEKAYLLLERAEKHD
jgi:hypothetical protein